MLDEKKGLTLLIDKPLHWTSFDVVAKLRYALSKKLDKKKVKVGHAGTLDPLATGLLVICAGKATKGISLIQDQEKEYTGTFTLGATTPSYDLETKPDAFFPIDHITERDLKATAREMTGETDQMPPIFSAKKVGGQKAYDMARKGEKPELKTRKINLYEFEITGVDLPEVTFRVRCSKGTYIRSLAYDFGSRLNSGAYLSELRRTAIGNYRVENALSVENAVDAIYNGDLKKLTS